MYYKQLVDALHSLLLFEQNSGIKRGIMNCEEKHLANKKGWNKIAKQYFGSTALPIYAPHMQTELELKLFDNLQGKKVLDIGCGSGHS